MLLRLMRNKDLKKKVIWVVAIVIIISFGLFGTAYLIAGLNPNSYAGKIFDKKVSLGDYQATYQQVRLQAFLQHGDNFNNIVEFLNLEEEAWDRLILLHEAEKRDIRIPNDLVIRNIQQFPYFQRNGQFDSYIYREMMKFVFKMRDRDFEEGVRNTLKISSLYNSVTTGATVTDESVYDAFQDKNEKIQVSYVLVPPDPFMKIISAVDEEKSAYYDENTLEFLMPSTIAVQYVHFPWPQEVLDAEESLEEDQELPEEPAALKQATFDEAKKLSDQVNSETDFPALVAENNLELQESKPFSLENPDLTIGFSFELLRELFDLNQGDVTNPVETSSGYFVVKITQKIEAYIPEYEEIQDKVEEAVIRRKAMIVTEDKASEALSELREKLDQSKLRDFAAAAEALNLDVYQTPEFRRGQYLPLLGISKNFQDTAFMLENVGDISEAIPTEKGYCFLHLDNRIPASEEQFLKEKDRIRQILLNAEKRKLFMEYQSQLRAEARLQNNISKGDEQ